MYLNVTDDIIDSAYSGENCKKDAFALMDANPLELKLAHTALLCGADYLGGTLMEDMITLASGGTCGEYTPAKELEWIIRQTGRTPQKRNALYEEIQ